MDDSAIQQAVREDCRDLARAPDERAEACLSKLWVTLMRCGSPCYEATADLLRKLAPGAASARAKELMEAVAYTLEDWVREPPGMEISAVRPSNTPANPVDLAPQEARLHFHDMRPGERFRVIRRFTDFDGNVVEEGLVLTFLSYSFFHYDGGYTATFEERVIRLAEIHSENREILESLSSFLLRINE